MEVSMKYPCTYLDSFIDKIGKSFEPPSTKRTIRIQQDQNK